MQYISLGIGSPAGITAFVLFGLSPGAVVAPEVIVLEVAGTYAPTIAISGSSAAAIPVAGTFAPAIDVAGAVES